MAFMEKEIYYGDWVMVDGKMGTEYTPAEYVDMDDIDFRKEQIDNGEEASIRGTSLEDYFENALGDGIIYEVDVIKGFGARMSASGYMDSTPWGVFDTEEEANDYLDEYYGDEDEFEEDEDF